MTIGIVLNTGKTQAVPIALRMLDDIRAARADAAIESESARLLGVRGGIPYTDVCDKADVLLVFGGDGTILCASEHAARRGVPILSVNLGRMGFLTELEGMSPGWLDALMNRRYTVDRRMMIVARTGGCEYHALNDFVLSRSGPHILQFSVSVGGRTLGRYAADGVVVATPTGSTAYSLSAGGPVISPELNCMVIAPICPHTLRARPVVVAPHEEIELRTAPGSGLSFSGDGIGCPATSGESIIVSRSPFEATFIRFKERNFYALLSAKLSEWDID